MTFNLGSTSILMRQFSLGAASVALACATRRVVAPRRAIAFAGTALALFTSSNFATAQPDPAKAPATPAPNAPAPETPNAGEIAAPTLATTPKLSAAGSPVVTTTNVPPAASEASTGPAPGAAAGAPPPASTAPTAPTKPTAPSEPATPAEPEAPLNALFDVAIVVQNVWNTAPAYDYFSADNQLLMGGLSVGVDALEVAQGTVLSLDLTAATGETEHTGPLPSYIRRSTLRRTDLGGGVAVRHHIWYWLAPHVRISGAAAVERASVSSPDFEELTVEETNFVGSVGGGLTLYSAAKRLSATRHYFNSLAFRLTAEGGYQFAGGVPFEVESTTPSEGIARANIPLGDLPQSGPYLRIAAGAHF
jgi:hypothetical protein